METKILASRMEIIRRKCRYLHGIHVGANGSKGGLRFGWKVDCVVTFRNFSNDHIDVEIQDTQGGPL